MRVSASAHAAAGYALEGAGCNSAGQDPRAVPASPWFADRMVHTGLWQRHRSLAGVILAAPAQRWGGVARLWCRCDFARRLATNRGEPRALPGAQPGGSSECDAHRLGNLLRGTRRISSAALRCNRSPGAGRGRSVGADGARAASGGGRRHYADRHCPRRRVRGLHPRRTHRRTGRRRCRHTEGAACRLRSSPTWRTRSASSSPSRSTTRRWRRSPATCGNSGTRGCGARSCAFRRSRDPS
jgi:hypothetical protein